ncbi:glycosyltransferase family A protein [Mesorhizobium sp. VNQ89]|uniref:glycosyltransferase family A protein n=1 Tax=Mesorhizobium quangtriensis TaxID=3157709 RepID=UPI0032B72618
MTEARILIAMPLFEGWEHVEQTLLSIQRQTFRDYRVLISVDGGDRRSYEACKSFAEDPRIEVVLQNDRLRWEGNINWLARHLREDYFCYWQHDDHCAPDYLEVLLDHADRHPEAASVYCDMQHFGTRNDVVRHRSVLGFALQRVLEQAGRANPAAIRCLVRREAMLSALPITSATTWTIAVARAGELHRIPRVLYFRRNRPESLGMQMLKMPEDEMLDFTLEYALGVFRHAYPLIQKNEAAQLLAMIADQLVNAQIRKRWQVDFAAGPSELRHQFVERFLTGATAEFDVDPASIDKARDLLARLSSRAPTPKSGGNRPASTKKSGFWTRAVRAVWGPARSGRRVRK